MNGNQLTASSAGGSQDATQNPQTAGAGNLTPGGKSDSVQTGTPTSALETSTGGIPLGGSSPTVVNVPAAKAVSTAQNSASKQTYKSTPLGTGLSIVFVIAAVILLWSALRPVKNTTE